MDLILGLLATVSRWSRSNLSEISLALVGCLLVLFGADLKAWVDQRPAPGQHRRRSARAADGPAVHDRQRPGANLRHALGGAGIEPVQQLQPGAGAVGGVDPDRGGGGPALSA